MIVLRGGDVVDSTGVRKADVAVEDGEIVAVGETPDADEEIDVSGQFVAPGLIDSHVHLMMDGRPDPASTVGESETMLAYRATANLRAALETGVTTVRDLGAPSSLALDAARAVDEGVVDGPRVVACGENVVMTGGHGHWFGREADGRAEVKKAAREQLKRGADVIKCMATGGVLTEGAITGAPELDEGELTALVETASAKRVPTAAHAHGSAGIKNAVRAGISSIEHGTFMDREAAELMAERGTYWVPTAKALHGIVDEGVEAGIPEFAVEKAEEAAAAFEEAFEHAIDAGVTVAMGTDAGTPFNFHSDIPEELELMVEYGLSPDDALEAATVNAADLLGLTDVGLVETGYRADLVVLDSDPRDDVTAWQSPTQVMSSGSIAR
ncbi:amidohydrolase family protein [Haladaptatus sp. NG-SE-30]